MDGNPVEILMVEDEAGDIFLAEQALKDATVSNHLNIVRDGEAALRFLHRDDEYENAPRPELILLDLNLPRVSGREVLSEIKNDSSLSEIPVVVLTTSDYEQDIAQCYRMHANCYITKPTDFEQFRAVVRSIDEFWLHNAQLPSRRRPVM